MAVGVVGADSVVHRARFLHAVSAAGAVHYGLPASTSRFSGSVEQGWYWLGDGSGNDCVLVWGDGSILGLGGDIHASGERLIESVLAGAPHPLAARMLALLPGLSVLPTSAQWTGELGSGGTYDFAADRMLCTFFAAERYDLGRRGIGIDLPSMFELADEQFALVARLAEASLAGPVTLTDCDVDVLVLEETLTLSPPADPEDVRLAAQLFEELGIRWEAVLSDQQEAGRIAALVGAGRRS